MNSSSFPAVQRLRETPLIMGDSGRGVSLGQLVYRGNLLGLTR